MFYPPGYCHMGKKNMFDGFKQLNCPIQLQELGTEFEIPQQRLGLSYAELILLRFVEYFIENSDLNRLDALDDVRCFEAFGWKFLTQ